MLFILWFFYSPQIVLISGFAFDSLLLYCQRQQNLDVPYVLSQFSLKLWLPPERKESVFSGLCYVEYLLHDQLIGKSAATTF